MTDHVPPERVAAAYVRFVELPVAYRDWVLGTTRPKGLPTLTGTVSLTEAQIFQYEALIGRCERQVAARAATQPQGDDAA